MVFGLGSHEQTTPISPAPVRGGPARVGLVLFELALAASPAAGRIASSRLVHDRLNTGHAANDYVILENLAKYHPDLYHVAQVRDFLRDYDEFLVFHRTDTPGYRWLELRLMNRQGYEVKQVGEVEQCAVYHVKRTANATSLHTQHVHVGPTSSPQP